MLMDKGYYDYDYEPVKKKRALTPEDKEIWSANRLDAMLGVKRKSKPITAEEMQRIAMEELKENKHD